MRSPIVTGAMILLLCFFAFAQAQISVGPTVTTQQGQVVGSIATDGNYYTFYGIPYAGDVSGSNRFKTAPAPPNYAGVYSAVENVICAQPSERGLIGVENCLSANIFTSDVVAKKPVLVWLEGEGYSTNDASTRSYRNLVNEFVVVTLNYRLSIFGFLCLGVTEAPGNAGLKDVVKGLSWIKSNIAGFGGNPDNVLLFGHGSGAAMADLVTMSALANGLVHKVAVASGSALAPWAVSYDPAGLANAVGVKLAYGGKSKQELARHIRDTSATLLVSAINQFDTYRNNTYLFAPCVENTKLNSSDTFLHDSPLNILRSGNYSQIPYVSGYTNQEGTLRAAQAALGNWLIDMANYFPEFLPVDLDFKTNATKTEEGAKIKKFYFGESNVLNVEDFLSYHGDVLVLLSVIRGAVERATTSSANVWLYELGFRGSFDSNWAYPQVPLSGVRHGEILNYLLNTDLKPGSEIVMRDFVERHAALANSGSPAINTNVTNWTPLSSTEEHYLYYSGGEGPVPGTATAGIGTRINPHEEKRKFWKEFYDKYYDPPKAISSANQVYSFGFVVALCLIVKTLY